MDWQQLVSLAIVASAASLFLRNKFVRPKSGAPGGSCGGCAAAMGTVPQYSVTYHARKGQRPEVLVKFN